MAQPIQSKTARALAAGLGIGIGIGALVSIASSGLAVYFARKVVTPGKAKNDVRILHVEGFDDDMIIHLEATPDTLVPGTYGLYFGNGTDEGFARIGDLIEYDPVSATVSRKVATVLRGDIRHASVGRWTGTVHMGPEDLYLPCENIVISSDVGALPSWFLPTTAAQPSDTWAILIHGRGGTRRETLRAAAVLDRVGIPSIAMSYRNDPEAERHQTYGLGDTEWLDVDRAIDFALANGARRIVLFGWSMGAAIAFQTASRGRHADSIVAMVLDGPVVDWYDVLDHQARLNLLPTPIARLTLQMITQPWARRLTGLETPLDLDRMDWVKRAADLRVPTLLIHSEDDEFVPVGPSRALAGFRRDLVTMPRYTKARHTKEWNVDRLAWEDDVMRFLRGLETQAQHEGAVAFDG